MKKIILASTLVSLSAIGFMSIAMDNEGAALSATLPYKNQMIALDVGVGDVRLVASDDDQIKMSVTLEPSNNTHTNNKHNCDSHSHATIPMNKRKIQTSVEHGLIKIALNDQSHVTQNWLIHMPKDADIDLHLGVGNTQLNGLQGEVSIEIGVGNAKAYVSDANYQKMKVETGVGKVAFQLPAGQLNRDSHLVGEELVWKGKGQSKMDIEVGVGDIDISTL